MSDVKTETVKKSKSKPSRPKHSSTSNALKLKVVIRRLPPNLPENIFWQSVGQWVTEQTASWKLYVPGKLRTKLNRESTPSRAYVEFLTPEAVIAFNRDYNGHLFRDKQGNESTAVVEYAPYQKVPHEKRKVDSKVGTIEADEDFISFVEALNKPNEPAPDVNELVLQALPSLAEPSSTPLLDALKAAKEASTIKGYHSHYREQGNKAQSRAQQLEDDATFSRKSHLPKPQQDPSSSAPSDSHGNEAEKGKEKDKEGGGKKGKNKPKGGGGPKSPKPTAAAPQPPTPVSPARPTGEPSRGRALVGIGARGGLLAALGAATEARASGNSRNKREPSGSGPVLDTAAATPNPVSASTSTSLPGPAAPPPPLPAGVIAMPSSLKPPENNPAPSKSRRGGKSRGGRGGKKESSESGATSAAPPTTLAEMPRIDDPGQSLPPAPQAPRGRGGNPGRGRGGRGRGRGRGAAPPAEAPAS